MGATISNTGFGDLSRFTELTPIFSDWILSAQS